jgi:hypothetical protein
MPKKAGVEHFPDAVRDPEVSNEIEPLRSLTSVLYGAQRKERSMNNRLFFAVLVAVALMTPFVAAMAQKWGGGGGG